MAITNPLKDWMESRVKQNEEREEKESEFANPLKTWMNQRGKTVEAYDRAQKSAQRTIELPSIPNAWKRSPTDPREGTYIPAQFGQRIIDSQNRRRYENTYVPASLAENALHGETDGEDYLSYSNARLRGEYLARADTAKLQGELDALERSIDSDRARLILASSGNPMVNTESLVGKSVIDTYEQKQAQAETLRRDIRDAGALQAEIARQSQQIANEKRYRNTYIPASLAQDAIHRSGSGADFNAYADARLRGEYLARADTAKLQGELDALERSIEQERKQYNRAKLRLASYGNNVGTTAARADQRYIDAYEQKQAQAQALRRDISDAESIQKAAEYNALRGRSDFAEKSKPAGTKIATFNLLDPSTWAAGDDKYDFINNIGGYKNTVRGLARADGAATEYGAYSSLARMTQDEIATYNYIYATEGKEAADEYLDFLEDELNYRQGQAEAALVEGSLLRSVGYSMGAGIRRFGDNIGDMFAGEVSAIRPYEYGTQIARENLADTGAQLPEWMGGASVGQVLFDAAGTAGNMLPSILLSTLTAGAGAAGAAAMGLSAGGGARMQAMREGYTPEQATMYGILVGASEGSLQYLLGGMSKLGGKLTGGAAAKAIQNIDHALLRIATSGTIKMAGEGAEEYLQEILDPIYRNLLLGENNQIDLTDPNAVYSFMLGALTAGVMDMPQIVSDGRTRTPSLQNSASAADASSATIPGRNNIDLVPSGNTHTDPASVGSGSISQGLSTNIIPETGEKGNRANGENGVKTEPYAYRDPATGMPMVGERAIAESAPLDVGAATHIKNPYTGRTPVQSQDVQRAEVDIPYEKVADARERMREAATNRGEKSFASTLRSIYKTLLEGRFAGQVEIPGVTFNDAPYIATIHNSVIKKVISDPGMSAEKLSVLENLRSVVANAEYVGSGKAVGKDDHIIRYDYFESRVRIAGQRYIAKVDIEARIDKQNRVRTYQINNIDLTPLSNSSPALKLNDIALGTFLDPTSRGFHQQEQGLFNNSISEKEEKSNHADAENLKKEKDTPAPFETETAKSGTSGATIPGENNIDLVPIEEALPGTTTRWNLPTETRSVNTILETEEKGNHADAENLKKEKDTPAPFETETAKSGTSGGTMPRKNNIDLVPIEEALPGPTPGGIFYQEQGLFNNTIPETGEKGNRADVRSRQEAVPEGAARELATTLEGATKHRYAVQEGANGGAELQARGKTIHLDAVEATALAEAYEGGMDAVEYVLAFHAVYEQARQGKELSQIKGTGIGRSFSKPDIRAAYSAGQLANQRAAALDPNSEFKAGVTMLPDAQLSREQEAQLNVLDAICRKYGVSAIVDDALYLDESGKTRGNVNAAYNGNTNRIHINLNALGDAYLAVGVHELTHYVKANNAAGYSTLEGFVLDALRSMGEDVDALVRYQMDQFGYSEAIAREEVVANTIPAILNDETYVKRLIEADRTLAERIRDFLREFIDTIKETLRTLEGEASWKQMQSIRQDTELLSTIADPFDVALGETQNQRSKTPIHGERFSIKYDVNNRPFVVVEENILDGVPKKNWVKTVKENLKAKFPDGVTVGRNKISINQTSRREMTFSKYMQWALKNDRPAYADKLRATDNADELLRASRDYVNEALLHPRNDRIREFARGNVLLRVGNNDYTASVIVGTYESGQMLLYDVISLMPTTITERQNAKDTATKQRKGEVGRSAVSAATVLQSDTSVNRSIRKNVQEDAKDIYDRQINLSAQDVEASPERGGAKKGVMLSKRERAGFARDKYYDRQIQRWNDLTDGARIKVGEVKRGSALNAVGMPDTGMYFDVGKIKKVMREHGDHLTANIMQQIPDLLSDPIVITQYSGNTISVYGDLFVGNTPVVVGVVMNRGANGQTLINKIRTIHARKDFASQITDHNVLYLNEDKKRTRSWFQVCGIRVPLDGNKFGLIRSIRNSSEKINLSAQDVEAISEQEGARATELTGKRKAYKRRHERAFIENVAKALGIPGTAKGELRKMLSELGDRVIATGQLSEADKTAMFEACYKAAREYDNSLVEQYGPLKEYLRNKAIRSTDLTSEQRSAAWGKLRMNGNGAPLANVYDDLLAEFPGVFDNALTSPEDQFAEILNKYDSIKTREYTLDEFHGENAPAVKAEMRADFEEALFQLRRKLNLADRSETALHTKRQERLRAAAEAENVQTVEKALSEIKEKQKALDRVMRKLELTEGDRSLMDAVFKGGITLGELQSRSNFDELKAYYDARAEVENRQKIIDEYNKKRRERLRNDAMHAIENSDRWKDKRIGGLYERETQERNIRDITGSEQDAERIIAGYIQPVHKNEAKRTRYINDMNARLLALKRNKNGKPVGLNKWESKATQLIGEAADYRERLAEIEKRRMGNSKEAKLIRKGLDLVGTEYAELFEKHGKEIDLAACEAALPEVREIYDQVFRDMNDALVRNGYPKVEYRKNYFPHFIGREYDSEGQKIAKAFGFNLTNMELPTDIAGLTSAFRPGKTWFNNALERMGVKTEFDLYGGFDSYIRGATDVIFHTDDIQRLRALDNAIRYKYSDEGRRARMKELLDNENITPEERAEQINALYTDEKGNSMTTHLSGYVSNLTEYTNLLANKKSLQDRGAEKRWGRKIYSLANWLQNRYSANAIAGNLGVSISNFIPITQATSEVGNATLLRAMRDTVRSFAKDDGFSEQSAFLTNRRGTDVLSKDWIMKANDKLSIPFEGVDRFASETLVRAKFAQNLKAGMSAEAAIENADAWAAGLMADRSKGALPTIFGSKSPLAKAFTMFQVEGNNQLSYMFKDVPRDMKEKGIAAIVGALFKMFLAAWMYNELDEQLTGRRRALDPLHMVAEAIGVDWKTEHIIPRITGTKTADEAPLFTYTPQSLVGAAEDLYKGIVDQTPFFGSLLGGDGGRSPAAAAMPDIWRIAKTLWNEDADGAYKGAVVWDELKKPLFYTLPPFAGGQVKKAAEGFATVHKGGSYKKDKEGNDLLRFRTDQKGLDYAQAILFGPWALPEGRENIAQGFPTLSAAHTAAYKNAVASGVDGAHFLVLLDRYKALEPIKNEAGKTEQSTKQQFREMLFRDSSLTNEQKTQMDRDLLCTEGQSPADYSSKSRFELSNHSPSAYERFEENIAGGMSEEEAFQLEDWANRFAGIQSYTDERGNYVGPQEQKRRMLFADETLTADEKEQIDRALIMGDGENARPADYSAKAMFDLFMQSESGYDNVIGATRKGIPEALALKVETWRQNQIARDNFSKDGYVDYMRGLGMSTSQINIILAETNKSWKPIE